MYSVIQGPLSRGQALWKIQRNERLLFLQVGYLCQLMLLWCWDIFKVEYCRTLLSKVSFCLCATMPWSHPCVCITLSSNHYTIQSVKCDQKCSFREISFITSSCNDYCYFPTKFVYLILTCMSFMGVTITLPEGCYDAKGYHAVGEEWKVDSYNCKCFGDRLIACLPDEGYY